MRGQLLLLAAVALISAAELLRCETADLPARGMRVVPLPVAGSSGNAALFIGANEFRDEQLRPLECAVNDAIALAYKFVLELKLIPPKNAYIALSGKPRALTREEGWLRELKQRGAHEVDAGRGTLLDKLLKVCSTGNGPGDLLIVSISSHGFE